MRAHCQETHVFIVRLWPANRPDAPFRAAIQRAGTDECAWFTHADALARYLLLQAGSNPADAPVTLDQLQGGTS